MVTFVDLETRPPNARSPMANMSYMRTSKKNPDLSLKIVLPTTITGQAKPDETFKLQISQGDQYSILRVVRQADGKGVKPSHMKFSSRFMFGFVPALGEDKFDGERFPVTKVDDTTYDIKVPPNFFKPVASSKSETLPNPLKKAAGGK